jgi:exodeoxyribonuclease VII large subunit
MEITRPDLLIVARGGGSIEDLWCFNEEIVVRSASSSKIPIISAVGHETDWTLMDYVADYRSPTPTGAGEKAVPVLSDLKDIIFERGSRLSRSLTRNIKEKKAILSSAKLPLANNILAHPQQSLDLILAKMVKPKSIFEPFIQKIYLISSKIPNLERLIDRPLNNLSNLSLRLNARPIRHNISIQEKRLSQIFERLTNAANNHINNGIQILSKNTQLLDAYSYQRVLDRGYVIVDDCNGNIIRTKSHLPLNSKIIMTFSDGKIEASIDGEIEKKDKKINHKKKSKNFQQPDLF